MRSRIDVQTLSNGRQFIRSVAASPEARTFYGPLPAASKGNVRNAILFGILTATERYEAAERALQKLQLEPSWPETDEADIRVVLSDAGIVYVASKARYVWSFLQRFNSNPTPFHPTLDESCAEYRDRLDNLDILGLGYVKVSFAAYLAYGGGNVICADRHIVNLWTGGQYTKEWHKDTKRARAALQEIEREFVALAAQYEWPSASALQWAVWCEAIQSQTTHAAVSAQESDK